MTEFNMLSVVVDFDGVKKAHEMLHELLLDNDRVIQILNEVDSLSGNHKGLQNFIQGRIDMHEKWSWMLRATVHP